MPYKYKKWKAREQQRDEAVRAALESENAIREALLTQRQIGGPNSNENGDHSVPNTPEMIVEREPLETRTLPKLDLARMG